MLYGDLILYFLLHFLPKREKRLGDEGKRATLGYSLRLPLGEVLGLAKILIERVHFVVM